MLQTGAAETDRGFSILEFLIVICIVGIMSASLVLWMDNAFGRSELKTLAAQLETRFSRAADEAKRTGRDQIVYMRRSADSTNLVFGKSAVRIAGPVRAAWVAAAEVGSSDDLGVIVFFGTGGASGGTLELTDGKLKTSIAVDWLTAGIKLAERDP